MFHFSQTLPWQIIALTLFCLPFYIYFTSILYTSTFLHFYASTLLRFYTSTLLHFYTSALLHYFTSTLQHYHKSALLHSYASHYHKSTLLRFNTSSLLHFIYLYTLRLGPQAPKVRTLPNCLMNCLFISENGCPETRNKSTRADQVVWGHHVPTRGRSNKSSSHQSEAPPHIATELHEWKAGTL